MHQLAALGQLIASAVLQVITKARGLGLAGVPGKVSALNGIGQPRSTTEVFTVGREGF
jgi:hypothetical protein